MPFEHRLHQALVVRSLVASLPKIAVMPYLIFFRLIFFFTRNLAFIVRSYLIVSALKVLVTYCSFEGTDIILGNYGYWVVFSYRRRVDSIVISLVPNLGTVIIWVTNNEHVHG